MSSSMKYLIKYNKLCIIIIMIIIQISFEDYNIDKDKIILFLKKEIFSINSKYLRNLNETNQTDFITDTFNQTFKPYNYNKGLSTGGIIGIAIPCVLAVLAALVAVFLCHVSKVPTLNTINPNPQNHIANKMSIVESTMDQLNVESSQQPPLQQVGIVKHRPQKEMVVRHPGYPVYKEGPSIPQVNRVFDPVYPIKKEIVPIQQVVEIKQAPPQISQVSQVISSTPRYTKISQMNQVMSSQPWINQISQVISSPSQINQISQVISSQPHIIQSNINYNSLQKITQSIPNVNLSVPQPETEHYLSESKIVSSSQVLPDITTSQISNSQIMPVRVLPNVTRSSQILPVKVLPPINQDSSLNYVEKVPHITMVNSNNQV